MLMTISDAIKKAAAMHSGYVTAEHRPTVSKVYRTRMAVSFSHDPAHETTFVDGFSWWDNLRQRWGAQRFTEDAAKKNAHTAALRYNVDQTKEWRAT